MNLCHQHSDLGLKYSKILLSQKTDALGYTSAPGPCQCSLLVLFQRSQPLLTGTVMYVTKLHTRLFFYTWYVVEKAPSRHKLWSVVSEHWLCNVVLYSHFIAPYPQDISTLLPYYSITTRDLPSYDKVISRVPSYIPLGLINSIILLTA